MPAALSSTIMFPDWIRTGVELAGFNTLALSARAALFGRVDSASRLAEVRAHHTLRDARRFVLGGGSNVVLGGGAGEFDGLLLQIALRGRELIGEDDEARYVRAGAGESWPEFVDWTLAQGWPGLENLALIPGTVGAAPIQNIGAYGVEVGDRLHSLAAYDFASGETRHFTRADCRFAYRDSVFKQAGWHRDGRIVVTEVIFRLPKRWQPLLDYAGLREELAQCAERALRDDAAGDARKIAAAVVALRRRKLPDPATLPNAGSFFHNPIVDALQARRLASDFPGMPQHLQADGSVKLAAGWLIERAGWKGRRLGPVGMYEKQALVLVNHGGACAADVAALAAAVSADVRRQFGITLCVEPVAP
ncbi:UDP-N-acetylmuramate dehydrogenase [Rhodocyclus tenuis]|uniref:UDP-N-acetylmuramate dehydrogenase n=1 Tax=Rhodocyclus tenuis TaxID=1066 RepID=UPI001F5B4D26|nr:UDP-N-acetylmuramate dehydrogenase [Rhodocyclus tenuis]